MLDLARRHAACIERNHLVVEAFQAPLAFLDQLGLEARIAIARHLEVELTAVGLDGFGRLAVARVAAATPLTGVP